MKKISTSALAKDMNISSKELFLKLESEWYIEFKTKWVFWKEEIKILTKKWITSWWEIRKSEKYGEYIIWPEDFQISTTKIQQWFLNAWQLAEKFSISARKMNQIISELWWIEKNIKWWAITKFWENLWGKELTIQKTWATYVKWPSNILENKSLVSSIKWEDRSKQNEEKIINHGNSLTTNNFREKFPAQYRTKDGHNVRSRWELLIDNALYEYWLPHAYERKLPIEEDVYSDFYIPAKNGTKAVYIEYWGIENQVKYEDRKDVKKSIYEKYHLDLIELDNHHIDNLDDYLPRMLLKYWINVD